LWVSINQQNLLSHCSSQDITQSGDAAGLAYTAFVVGYEYDFRIHILPSLEVLAIYIISCQKTKSNKLLRFFEDFVHREQNPLKIRCISSEENTHRLKPLGFPVTFSEIGKKPPPS
jgi:hypothetical protein